MNPSVLTAAITASATMLTAIVALVLNARGFTLLDKRIDDLRSDTNRRIDETSHRIDETNRRLERIESDLKEFFKVQAEHDKRIQRLEDGPR